MNTHFVRSAIGALLAGVLLFAAAGCDSNDDELVPLNGRFEATTLTGEFTNNDGVPTDLLEDGGDLILVFDEDGSVEGTFAVPEAGNVATQSLSGRYQLESDGDLRFNFDLEDEPTVLSTFISQGGIDWTYADDTIRGELDGFEAVLVRSP